MNKLCKYCRKEGKFDRNIRKVLCDEHRYFENQVRHLWIAVSDLQFGIK